MSRIYQKLSDEKVFENEEMKELNFRILKLEAKFKEKYSPEIFNDYLKSAELMLEELILACELYFELGFDFGQSYKKADILKS